MAALSTAAWIAHDLGLATGVGGSVFGRMAMHPAVRHVSDRQERGQIVSDAWRTFNVYQLAGVGLMAATWFAGRTFLSGREVDEESRTLVLVKDGLVLACLGTAIGAAITGRMMARQSPEQRVPLDERGNAAPDAPEPAKRLNRVVSGFGLANILCGIGVLATTTILAMRAGESGKWSWVSRRLV